MLVKNYIAFILPGKDKHPVGGYKVVYEYANRFAADGYETRIIYPHVSAEYKKEYPNPFFRLKMFLGFYYRKIRKQLKAAEWFPLDRRIKKIYIFKFTDLYVRKFKNYKMIATAIRTAYELNNTRSIPQKNKYYFIQDFEAWGNFTDKMVYDSYCFPMQKITIAPWLVERIESVGQTAALIPNGFDFTYFQLSNPIENRSSTEVAMLYHLDDRKRCCDSMAALDIVKQQIPSLHVTMFGTPIRPDNLPEWYTYYQTPDRETHNMIYNNAAIFVAASKAEGMALPPAESMICGCALVCTEIPGFALYAKNNETALTSPVFDVQKLADNIIILIKNIDLRMRIATSGNNFIKQFTWEKAFILFKKTLEN